MTRVTALNLARQLGQDAGALSVACKGADVILGCEAIRSNGSPLVVSELLPAGWEVYQDTDSPARAGSFVAWRLSTMEQGGEGEHVQASRASVPGEIPAVRPRFIAHIPLRERSTGDTRTYAAFHAPLRKTGRQEEFYGRLVVFAKNHPRAVLGGDCNRPHANVADLLVRLSVGDEVMGIFVPASLRVADTPDTTHPGSDHPIVRATLTAPTRKETAVSAHPKTDAWVAAMRRRGVEVLTHRDWNSAHPDSYVRRIETHPHGLLPQQPVDTVWGHITVTFDDGRLIGHFKADAHEIERIGDQRFGSGVSYNLLVDRNAGRMRVALGQFLEAKGTHTVNDKGIAGFSFNQNKVAIAIAWVGNPGDSLDEHAVEAYVQAIAAGIEVGAITRDPDVVPHSLVAAKDCPTAELRDRLGAIKRRAIAAATPAPVPAVDTMTRVERIRADLLKVLDSDAAKSIPASRVFVRTLLATIRATTLRLPKE